MGKIMEQRVCRDGKEEGGWGRLPDTGLWLRKGNGASEDSPGPGCSFSVFLSFSSPPFSFQEGSGLDDFCLSSSIEGFCF